MSQASETELDREALLERHAPEMADGDTVETDVRERLNSVQQRQAEILERLDAIEEQLGNAADEEAVRVAINHTIAALTGADLESFTAPPVDYRGALVDFREDIEGAIQGLQTEIDRLDNDIDGARKSIANSTNETVVKVCEQALRDASADQAYVVMRPGKIAAAADVSERHGYNLVDELPEKYPSLFKHNSEIQRDPHGRGRAEKALAVRIEPLQSNRDQLNRFINDLEGTGGA